MRNFIIYFLVFFIVFTFIGFNNGRELVSKPDFLKNHIFQKLSLVQLDSAYYLSYKRDELDLFLFNSDSDSLTKIDNEILLNINKTEIKDKNILNYLNSSTSKALGAGFLGYSIKDLFKNSKSIGQLLKESKGRGKVIGTVLGSISGYSLGYWVATHRFVPGIESKEYSEILLSKDFWKESEKSIYSKLYSKTENMISVVPDSIKRREFTLQQDLLLVRLAKNKTSSNKIIVNSVDFKGLLTLEQKVEPIYIKEKSKLSTFEKIMRFAGITILTIFLGAFIILNIFPEIKDYFLIKKLAKLGNPNNIKECVEYLSNFLSKKKKNKIEKMNVEEFMDKYGYDTGRILVKTWSLDWKEKDAKKIPKPKILDFFENLEFSKYYWDYEELILRCFYEKIKSGAFDIQKQIERIEKENSDRKKKASG